VSGDAKSYYEWLHVSRDAPTEVIKASYRTLMQRLRMHPDLGGDEDVAAVINEAYAVLTDPDRRARYDRALAEFGVPAVQTARPRSEPAAPRPAALNPHTNCLFCGAPHDYGKAVGGDTRCASCDSPLAPTDDERMEREDARAVARVLKRQPVEFFTGWPQAAHMGRTEDVSLRGSRLVSGVSLETGQLVKLRCRQFDAVARVVNQSMLKDGPMPEYAAGLRFVTLSFKTSRGSFVSHQA